MIFFDAIVALSVTWGLYGCRRAIVRDVAAVSRLVRRGRRR